MIFLRDMLMMAALMAAIFAALTLFEAYSPDTDDTGHCTPAGWARHGQAWCESKEAEARRHKPAYLID